MKIVIVTNHGRILTIETEQGSTQEDKIFLNCGERIVASYPAKGDKYE